MSLIKAYPQAYEQPISSQDSIAVATPAVSPTGTLQSQITVSNLSRDKAFIGTHFNAGNYLIIISMAVSGNPPIAGRVPALQVSYTYDGDGGSNGYTIEGVTSQGTDVIDGFTVTQSVQFAHSGQGVISAGTVGGRYSGNWSYAATVSIYRV